MKAQATAEPLRVSFRFPILSPLIAVLLISSGSQAQGDSHGALPFAFEVERGVRQLFLDDLGIAEMKGLTRVVHPPKRHPDNPLLVPDTPWERGCQVYGTAYYDASAKLFKLWYLTGPKDRGLRPLVVDGRERAPHTTLAAYAISKDGVKWTKPRLGVFSYDGDKRNNLLGIGRYNCEGISVLHDPTDPNPQRRWKAAYWDHGSGGWEVRNGGPYAKPGPNDGWHVAFSPDGVQWTPYEKNPVLRKYCDTNQNVLYDPRIKKYVGYSRFGFGRRLARTESKDFIHWSEPKLVLACDAKDGTGTQIYGAGVDLYESVYLAMVWIYREGGDRKIDTQLATSRDGIRWTRVANRATWLKLGNDESWEGGMVRSVERIIRRGDRLYVYYCGVHGPHVRDFKRKHPVSIGLVTQRRDGFVSMRVGEEGGDLLTSAFRLPRGELHINADVAKGRITATLCNGDGKPVTGFGSSKALSGDLLDGRVTWDKQIPSTLRGKPVRLKFSLSNGDLFSYWWR